VNTCIVTADSQLHAYFQLPLVRLVLLGTPSNLISVVDVDQGRCVCEVGVVFLEIV